MPDPLAVTKIATRIPGLDYLTDGGLPAGRSTLVSGTAGSAKTVLAAQFLIEGIDHAGEPGVFVTFEESAEDIRRNLYSFGWDVTEHEARGHWAFVDASPDPAQDSVVVGGYDLGALLARIDSAVKRTGATRLSMDSVRAVFSRFTDSSTVRRELFRIAAALKSLGVISLITAERTADHGEVARMGVEEFVTDNVIILRHALEGEKRRRTVEVLKFRGASHRKGEYPFTVMPGQGIVVIPLSAMKLGQRSSQVRITSGSPDLDRMCGGGFFRDSVVAISGATGTGKTLMATECIAGGAGNGERCLLFAFEESRQQLYRNASGWDVDFEAMEREGTLEIICAYPESDGLDDHLIRMKQAIERFRPARVAVDSLSALERVASVKRFREFVIALISFIKHQEIAILLTATTPGLFGGTSVTEAHISTITDSIVLLRYVEMPGEMRRGLTVLKMRGSRHDNEIREYSIDASGMHIGEPLRDVAGIFTGHASQLHGDEHDGRLASETG